MIEEVDELDELGEEKVCYGIFHAVEIFISCLTLYLSIGNTREKILRA